MTELQKIELDILKTALQICDELELKYYLVCGSALGAVKYQGFIPWDDDVDIALPRPDYQKFCEKVQLFLPEYYFLQNYKTDPEFPMIYSKIRDSRTTFVEASSSKLNINHGVYIDIFPLDGYPKDEKNAKRFERKKRLLKLQLSCAFSLREEQSLKSKIFMKLERLLGLHKKTQRTACKLEKLISRYNIYNSELWCNHGNWQGELEYASKWHYGEGYWSIFEGVNVRIPEEYDAYLTQKYGDWRADLPEEKRKSHHDCLSCDLSKSYVQM